MSRPILPEDDIRGFRRQIESLQRQVRELQTSPRVLIPGAHFEGGLLDYVFERVQTDTVIDAESTGSVTYTDLDTAGPQVAVTVLTGRLLVFMTTVSFVNAGSGNENFMSLDVDGPTAISPSTNEVRAIVNRSNDPSPYSAVLYFDALEPGSYTLTAKYRAQPSGSATALWSNRTLVAWPL